MSRAWGWRLLAAINAFACLFIITIPVCFPLWLYCMHKARKQEKRAKERHKALVENQ